MDRNNLYLSNTTQEVVVPPFCPILSTNTKSLGGNSTIYVNPLCANNKILINKNKLSASTRNNDKLKTLPTSDKIYYNPKFFTQNVKTQANIYIKPFDEQPTTDCVSKTSTDSNIYVNKHYLHQPSDIFTSSYVDGTVQPIKRGIYFNPKFFNKQQIVENLEPTTLSVPTKNVCNSPTKIDTKSKYKLVKKNIAINITKPFCFKTKYSFKRQSTGKDSDKCRMPNEIPKLKTLLKNKLERLSSEFKKFSRTKLVRKSVLQSLILARRRSGNNLFKKSNVPQHYKRMPTKKKSKNITYFPKKTGQVVLKNDTVNNSFKKISKTKIVRKSLLKAQIEARYQVRKQCLLDRRALKFRSKSYISKCKLKNNVLRKKVYDISKRRELLKWKKKKKKVLPNLSRVKGKKRYSISAKHLRKNNQPCPFYNRFGRCKGKDKGTCSKLHDPTYISICRKLLQGECNAKDCLLSHDIRPGKMPTCHHYLAGLCTRQNCPFLHIKVNPKAPICMEFLRGFCPDVYNCMKRHEFICPIFAEKGSCPRGKSCTYPHRSPVIHCKLLKDDQKPLILRKDPSVVNSKNSSNLKDTTNIPIKSSLDSDIVIVVEPNVESTKKNIKKPTKEYVKETFVRYFDIANKLDESCDNDESDQSESDEDDDSMEQDKEIDN